MKYYNGGHLYGGKPTPIGGHFWVDKNCLDNVYIEVDEKNQVWHRNERTMLKLGSNRISGKHQKVGGRH